MLSDIFILFKTNVYLVIIVAVLILVCCIELAIYYWGDKKYVSVALIIFIIGVFLNTFVKVLNGGKFPVNGWTMMDIQEKGYRVWNYIPGDNAKFNVLGDHPELWGASIGDLFLLVGVGICGVYTGSSLWQQFRTKVLKR